MNTEKFGNFIKAIREKRVILITFSSKEKGEITRRCIPFDFGPWRRNILPNPERYHLYDLDSPEGQHNLSVLPEQLSDIVILDENFDPSNYITWTTNWFIPRDWGIYS